MATRPTSELDWGGTAVEPSGGQKTAGFAPGDRPPAQWFNFFFQNIGDWIAWLDTDRFTEFLSASRVFADGLTVSSVLIVGDDASVGVDLSVGRNLVVTQDGTVTRDLTVGRDLHVVDDLQVDDDATVTGTASVGDLQVGTNITAGGTLTAAGAIISVAGDVISGAEVTVGTNLNLPSSLALSGSGGELVYLTPKSRVHAVSLCSAVQKSGPLRIDLGGDFLGLPPGYTIEVPLAVPTGGTLGDVRVKLQDLTPAGAAATYNLRLRSKTGVNFGNTSTPAYNTVASSLGASASGVVNTTLSFGGLTIAADESYSIEIECDPGSADALVVWAIDCAYTDPGPRNF